MPWNLLIFPLLGGYFILSRFNFFKFRQQRLDRQRLIFDSVLVAIFLIISTFILRYTIEFNFPRIIKSIYFYLPIKSAFFGTTLFSFLIAVFISEIGNITFFNDYKKYIDKSIKKVGNELELMLRSSLVDSKMLSFTLDTGKFYIVWVKELPIPTVTNYIRVIPVFSGYRDDKKEMIFTTHYLSVYSEYVKEGQITAIQELDVDLIITLDNVVTVSYFDIEMYERFSKVTTK